MRTPAPLDLKALGALLKLWRKRAGLTQAQLATAIGTSRPNIGQIERGDYGYGKSTPRIDKLVRWAHACHADARQALELVDACMFGAADEQRKEAACG